MVLGFPSLKYRRSLLLLITFTLSSLGKGRLPWCAGTGLGEADRGASLKVLCSLPTLSAWRSEWVRAEHHSSDHDLQAGQKSSINAAQALAAVNAVSEALVCGAELKGAPKTCNEL